MSTAPNTSRKSWACPLCVYLPGTELLGDVLLVGGADGGSRDLLAWIPRATSLLAFAAEWRWCLAPWVFQLLPGLACRRLHVLCGGLGGTEIKVPSPSPRL